MRKLETKEDVKQLLEEIETNRRVLTTDMPPVEFKHVATYQNMKARAGEALRDAETDLRRFAETHMGGIVPQGSEKNQREFAEIAKPLGDTLVYDTAQLYRDICHRAFASMAGTGNFGVDQIQLISSEIRLKMRAELSIFRMRDPDWTATAGTSMQDLDDLANRVRASVRRTNGMLLTSKSLFKFVGDECLANPNPRLIIPVVILGVKESELAELDALLPNRNVVVTVDDVEDMEETVKDAFLKLKNAFKSKSN